MAKINFLFLFFCLFFFIFKIFATSLTKFDLFGDEAQYWFWSQSFEFGYFSKPPLLSWLIGIVSSFFGSGFLVLKTIPIITYCITPVVVYFISIRINKDNSLALLTSISFFLIHILYFLNLHHKVS